MKQTFQDSLRELEAYEQRGEKAIMKIEHDGNSKALVSQTSYDMSTPVSANQTIVVPQGVRVHAVTTVMASQIQAFDESFTVK